MCSLSTQKDSSLLIYHQIQRSNAFTCGLQKVWTALQRSCLINTFNSAGKPALSALNHSVFNYVQLENI